MTGANPYRDQHNAVAVPLAATSGAVAAATATATLAHNAAGDDLVYITGFEITGGGATAASVIAATVTGLVGNITLTYEIPVPAGVTLGITPLVVEFPMPIPAKDTSTDIVVSAPSFGAGNTAACVNAHGFKLQATS